jgi:hypothetical protein
MINGEFSNIRNVLFNFRKKFTQRKKAEKFSFYSENFQRRYINMRGFKFSQRCNPQFRCSEMR